MTQFSQLQQQFIALPTWQDRYRLLIQLSRDLPKPEESELKTWQEIYGCESRFWVNIRQNPFCFQAYSDARLMQGIVQLLILATQATPPNTHFYQILTDLGIASKLSETRLNALKQLEQEIQVKISVSR